MKKNISIPLVKIGNEITITIGKPNSSLKNVFHIDSILSEWTKSFLEEYSLISDNKDFQELSGILKIKKEQGVFRVDGNIEFEPILECVRSLTLFREKINSKVKGFFVTSGSQKFQHSGILKLDESHGSEEIELTENDLESYIYHGNAIHLDELLLDTMFCNLPELPLCRENCKGLCSECGTDLNETDLLGKIRSIEHSKQCSKDKYIKLQ